LPLGSRPKPLSFPEFFLPLQACPLLLSRTPQFFLNLVLPPIFFYSWPRSDGFVIAYPGNTFFPWIFPVLRVPCVFLLFCYEKLMPPLTFVCFCFIGRFYSPRACFSPCGCRSLFFGFAVCAFLIRVFLSDALSFTFSFMYAFFWFFCRIVVFFYYSSGQRRFPSLPGVAPFNGVSFVWLFK